MSLRFTVRFSAPDGKREMEQFHSLPQATAFAARHGEWVHDDQLRCEFHPSFEDPDECRTILAEVSALQDVTAKIGGGGGAVLSSGKTERRAAVLKPGLNPPATSWSGVCPHPIWRDCHLLAWGSSPYIFHARSLLRTAALALRLPLYCGVLPTERAQPILQTHRYLERFRDALLAAAKHTSTTSPANTMQACGKCGRVTLAAELTVGGLCLKCSYARDLAPGIWEDHEGGVHFDIPAILRLFGVVDTPENREIATRNIQEVLRRQLPNELVHLRQDQPPTN